MKNIRFNNRANKAFQAIGKLSSLSALAVFAGLQVTPVSHVQAADSSTVQAKGPSGLPLPRFVSLKAKRVNMRVGPGLQYKVEWMFTKPGLPLEILKEYDNWRKVRDSEGAEGWINKSLLSGKRTALVAPWKSGKSDGYLKLVSGPGDENRLLAKMEPGVLTRVNACVDGWCKVEVDDTVTGSISGYTRQTQLWGVYPDETLD